MKFTRFLSLFCALLVIIVGIGPITVYAAAFDECPAEGTLVSHEKSSSTINRGCRTTPLHAPRNPLARRCGRDFRPTE